MIYCKYCGNELNESATFCTECGAQVQAGEAGYAQTAAYSAAPHRCTFLNSFLSLILFALLLFALLLLGLLSSPYFLLPQNLGNIIRYFAILLPLALAAVLTTRAKGPDLSVGSMMLLSAIIIAKTTAESGSWATGLLLAVAICAALGAVNGALTVYARLPALAVTGAMFIVVWLLSRALTSEVIPVQNQFLSSITSFGFGILLFCVICFAAAFLLIALTRLGTPMIHRERKKEFIHMLAYIVSGVFAALAGLLMLSRIQAASPMIGYSYIILVIFVSGCVASSRLFDNRFVPAVIALVAVLLWSLMNNVLVLLSVSAYTQLIISVVIAAAFGVAALINWAAARKAPAGPR